MSCDPQRGFGSAHKLKGGGKASTWQKPQPQHQTIKSRNYSPRKPTAGDFSRNWSFVGQISPWDKMEALERCCSNKFAKETLLTYAQDEDSLNAMVWFATGWQPGTDLPAFNREDFCRAFSRLHADRGHPLLKTEPEKVLVAARQVFGMAEKLSFTLDICPKTGQQFISDGRFSHRLPIGRQCWELFAPPLGKGPDCTIVSNGQQHVYANSLFRHVYEGSANGQQDSSAVGSGKGTPQASGLVDGVGERHRGDLLVRAELPGNLPEKKDLCGDMLVQASTKPARGPAGGQQVQLCLQTLGFPCMRSAPDPHCRDGLSNNAMTLSSSMGASSLVQANQAQHSDQAPPEDAVAAKIREIEHELVQYDRLQELKNQLARQERVLKSEGVITSMQEQETLAKHEVKQELKPNVVKREFYNPGNKKKIHIDLVDDDDELCPTVPSGNGINGPWSER